VGAVKPLFNQMLLELAVKRLPERVIARIELADVNTVSASGVAMGAPVFPKEMGAHGGDQAGCWVAVADWSR